ncbi:MAG: hypothetical protein JZD40_07630, partial [Sulfolobus sp.]|nr:hypothetical protein [Sulfolobus sp.]
HLRNLFLKALHVLEKGKKTSYLNGLYDIAIDLSKMSSISDKTLINDVKLHHNWTAYHNLAILVMYLTI